MRRLLALIGALGLVVGMSSAALALPEAGIADWDATQRVGRGANCSSPAFAPWILRMRFEKIGVRTYRIYQAVDNQPHEYTVRLQSQRIDYTLEGVEETTTEAFPGPEPTLFCIAGDSSVLYPNQTSQWHWVLRGNFHMSEGQLRLLSERINV